MDSSVIVGIFSFAASVIGTFGGIVVSSRLTNYRIGQLEDKVSKHNNLIERTYQLERDFKVLENREAVSEHRIKDLEGEVKNV